MRQRLANLTPTDIFLWIIRIVIIAVIVWGSYRTLESRKYSGENWADFIVFGLSQGGIYALIALGYTLVYGILLMINFAHGEVFMSGAFTAYHVAIRFGDAGFFDGNLWWLALIIGVAAFLGLVGLVALGIAETWFADPDLPGFYLWWAVATLDTWPWIVVMWFVGMRYLDVSNRWLRYGQEAIVPFYVFHQPVIVVISYYIVQWQLGVTLKMLVIFFGSLAITLAIVELIRRIAPLRALFGMKVAGRPLTIRPQESTPSARPGTPPPA